MSDPQFVVGGPRIPSEIIRALEEERLVFFCGAGISIRTGLPNFRDLTLEAIKHIDRAPGDIPADPAIRDAYDQGSFDKALDILEDKEGRRGDLRRFVAKRLTRRMRDAKEQLRIHTALLDLSWLSPSNEGERGYRLVTTNYDDRFEKAGLPRRWIEAAPRLARPQANRAGYVTFLHGRIQTDKVNLDPGHTSLVLTSADFGDAYLRDGYAARFVLELFREFTVLFIGYSLSDPVMRYLMDIFATENDESRQGQFRPAYAFVAHSDEDAEHQYRLWEAKHVVPVLYNYANSHETLTQTLENWAHVHRAASDGRFQIFMEAVTKPFQANVDVDNLANAAWALADKRHRTARRLGSLNPDEDGPDADISWFGALLESEVIDPRDESRRPKKCRLLDLEEVAFQLCRWAVRHCHNRHFVHWAVSNELLMLTKLRDRFFPLLIRELYSNEPKHFVKEPYKLFWQLLVGVASSRNEIRDHNAFWLMVRTKNGEGPQIGSVVNLLQAQLRWPTQPFRMASDDAHEPERLSDLARYEIYDWIDFRDHHRFRDLFFTRFEGQLRLRGDCWTFVDDLTTLLVGICKLGVKIDASFSRGFSRHIRESIAPDVHNDFRAARWEFLIEAVVQSFETACKQASELAISVAQRWSAIWRSENQTLFGRLYLHAVTHMRELSVDEAVRACLDQPDVLWRYEYEAELLALLRVRGSQISEGSLHLLVVRVLDEPPVQALPNEYDPRDIDNKRGQRFAKLLQAGVELQGAARTLADEYLRQRSPSEDPREDEVRDRITKARWVGPPSGKELVGREINEVVEILNQGRDEHGFPHDEWSKAKQVADWLRQEKDRIVEAIEALAELDDAPIRFVDGIVWALRDVTTQPEVVDQIDRIAAALAASPSMIDASHEACSAWVKVLATSAVSDETFWFIWSLVQARAPAEDPSLVRNEDISLDAAINSAGGFLTEAVIDRFWMNKPTAGQGLPLGIRDRLTQLVSGSSRLAVHARLVCMPPLHALYAVDPDWTKQNLLPHLTWNNQPTDMETSALWSAQLGYGRWSLDLMAAIKRDFLIALEKREILDHEDYRSACWRFAALGIDRPSFLTNAETRDGFHSMGAEGASFVLGLFETRLRQSEQPADQWREMIAPWLRAHWPPQEAFRRTAVFSAAAEMLLETREAFAEALGTLEDLHLVGVIDQNGLVLFRLARTENGAGNQEQLEFPLLSRFPLEVCRWLHQILPLDIPGHEHNYLRTITESIQQQLPPGPPVPDCLLRLRDRI